MLSGWLADAVPASVRGSVAAGGVDHSVPPPEPGDPLRLLPARLHHTPVPQPHHLWVSGRELQKVLDPLPYLSDRTSWRTRAPALQGHPQGQVRTSGSSGNGTIVS